MAALTWRVAQLASQRGWSTRGLAAAAGLDEKTVRNIVAGRATRVDLDTIARLSSVLQVAPGALWEKEPDRAATWTTTAGAAGRARPEELEQLFAGDQPETMDSALERATRSP